MAATHLNGLKPSLTDAKLQCEQVPDDNVSSTLAAQLQANRQVRQELLQQFKDDLQHKCSRIDNTFEEKEEELREFYSDLERKLHIHN